MENIFQDIIHEISPTSLEWPTFKLRKCSGRYYPRRPYLRHIGISFSKVEMKEKNVKAPIETGLSSLGILLSSKGQVRLGLPLVQGTSHKPWWLTGVVKPAGVEGARVKEAWQPPPRFQRMYEKA